MTEISVPSPRQAPSAADVVRVLQAAYPNAWEKHLRNLGVTAPTDLPPAELTQFTNRVFWLVRQSGIKDPAAWVAANPAPVEATVAAATAPNRKSLKWNRRRRRRRPHHRAASSRCTAQAARAGRATSPRQILRHPRAKG